MKVSVVTALDRICWTVNRATGGPTVQHRELYSILCNDLYEKRISERGDICLGITDSLCCTAETNTIL